MTEVSFPEHVGVVTDANCGNLARSRNKMAFTIENVSDVNLEGALGKLERAM